MMGSQISFTPNDEILRLLQKTIEISRQTTDATGTVQLIQDIELMARLGYPTQALGHLQELSTEFEDSTCQAIVANVAEQLVVRRDMQRVLEFLQTIDKAPTWKDAVLMDCVQICLRHQQIDEAVRLITMVQDQRVRDRACFYIAVTYARMGQGEEGLQLVRDFQVELTPELGQHMLQASMHGRHYDWFLQHLEPLAEDKDRSLQRALGWAADHGDFEFVLQVMQSRFQPGSQQMELAFRTLAGQCDSASALDRARRLAPEFAGHPRLAFGMAVGYARAGQLETAFAMASQAAKEISAVDRDYSPRDTRFLATSLRTKEQKGERTAARSLLEELTPSDLRASVKVQLARSLMQEGQHAEARDLAESLVEELAGMERVNPSCAISAYPLLAYYGFEAEAREYLDTQRLDVAIPVIRYLLQHGKSDECRDLLRRLRKVTVGASMDPDFLREIAEHLDGDTALALLRRIMDANPATPGAFDCITRRYAELLAASVREGLIDFARPLRDLLERRYPQYFTAPRSGTAGSRQPSLMAFHMWGEMLREPCDTRQLGNLAHFFEEQPSRVQDILQILARRGETEQVLRLLEQHAQRSEQALSWSPAATLPIYRSLVQAGQFEELLLQARQHVVPDLQAYETELLAMHRAWQQDFPAAIHLADTISSPRNRRLVLRYCIECMSQVPAGER